MTQKFINGLIVKAPNDRAPEYVKARLSIKREELIAWLQTEQGEWINADIKVSQGGKWFAAVDDWKPQGGQRSGPPQRTSQPPARNPPPAYDDDDINF
jgi:hypothetical protein